jgi:hypothetical protein
VGIRGARTDPQRVELAVLGPNVARFLVNPVGQYRPTNRDPKPNQPGLQLDNKELTTWR